MVKRIVFAAIAAISALSLFAGAAFAGSPNSAPGTPGTPNCFGQTVAFVAQGGVNAYFDVPPGTTGIGNIARAIGISNQGFKQIGQDECAS